MQLFDPSRPLVSLHIPKCAGQSAKQSFTAVTWGGYRYLEFYPEFGVQLDPTWNAARTVVFGHFIRWKGHAVETILGGADHQFTTIVRDPFDTLLSGYFYGLQNGMDWAAEQSIDSFLDWFLATKTPPLTGSLPDCSSARTVEEYAQRFIAIGTAEHLDAYIDEISRVLGTKLPRPPRINTSEKTRATPDRRREFELAFPFDFELHRYCSGLNR